MAVAHSQVSKVPRRQPVYPCKWKEEIVTALEIVQNQEFPIVAMVKNTTTDVLPNFDTSQPLLVYSSTVKTKVVAHGIVPNPESANVTEATERVVIPEDYTGWFMYNPWEEKESISRYSSIAALVQTDVKEFLIGGDTTLLAVREEYNETTGLRRKLEYLAPGDVLKRGRVVSREITMYSRKCRSQKVIKKDYLMCTNMFDREFLIPCNQMGLFYPILFSSKRTLFQMCHLLKEQKFPCDVQLVFGRPPGRSFNPKLRLLLSIKETSIVASTIFKHKNVLVEFNIDLSMYFLLAENMLELIGDARYQDALNQCQRKAKLYSRRIKVYPYRHKIHEGGVDGHQDARCDEDADNDCHNVSVEMTNPERGIDTTQTDQSESQDYENMEALKHQKSLENSVSDFATGNVAFMNDSSDSSVEGDLEKDKIVCLENTTDAVDTIIDLRTSLTFPYLSRTNFQDLRDSGYTGSTDPHFLETLSIREVSDALRDRMVDVGTINALRRQGVDGRVLNNMDDNMLRESVPGITGLDVTKINLYRKGWELKK